MGRTVLRQAEPTRTSRRLSRPALVGIAVILLLALLGVISAGAWVGGQLSGGTKTAQPRTHQTPPSSVASQEVAQAQAQATAIVREAQSSGHAIISSATARAHKRARAIVAAARHQAASITAAAAAHPRPAAPSSGSTGAATSGATTSGAATSGTTAGSLPTGSSTAPSTSSSTTSSTGVDGAGSSGTVGNTASGGQPFGAAGATLGGAGSTPNLSGLPASWRVVGYNASFGGGPGGAGSITVTNRGFKTYSGVARVVYAGGGSASASFSGLAPGQTEVLPLNGPAYRGGGYRIVVNVP